MINKVIELDGRISILCGDVGAETCFIELVGGDDEEIFSKELEQIKKCMNGKTFVFAALKVSDWNHELSPWEAPAVYGKDDFGDGAEQTLSYVLEKLIPEINQIYDLDNDNAQYIIGGYSLAGLFALWAGYQTSKFTTVAAVSPSVWYPKWDLYINKHDMQAKKVYLSLGDKEDKTKNQVMAKVSERIRLQYDVLISQIGEFNCVLEWNPGNHFREPDIRMSKAFSWIIKQIN